MRFRHAIDETSWDNVQRKLRAGSINAKELAKIHYLIGSNLPYATHWIEAGYRDDPRRGHLTITYRTPAATNFMANAVRKFKTGGLRRRRPSESLFGVGFLPVAFMQQKADDIVESMQDTLDKHIYRRGAQGHNVATGDTWTRMWALYNSVKSRRV